MTDNPDKQTMPPVSAAETEPWHGMPTFESESNAEEREIADLEPAWGKAATFFRTGYRFGHARGSTSWMPLVEIDRLLRVYESQFVAGDTLSLLQAISMCAEENLPLPYWLASAFRRQLSTFMSPGPLRSLDEVFRSDTLPTASARSAADARQDWQLGATLWSDAFRLVLDDKTLTSFDQSVERLLQTKNYGVGKTKAKQLIKMVETSQSQLLNKDVSVSGFLAKRRKQMK